MSLFFVPCHCSVGYQKNQSDMVYQKYYDELIIRNPKNI